MSIQRQKPSRAASLIGASLALALMTGTALASDALRGAFSGEATPGSTGPDWAGFYGGVHAGILAGTIDPNNVKYDLAAKALPQHPTTRLIGDYINFNSATKMKSAFGAFVGFNTLWDEVVLGIEADYTRSSLAHR
jgi:outer membrane immunogenic protein